VLLPPWKLPGPPSNHHLLSFDDDRLRRPPPSFGDAQHVGFANFTLDTCNMASSSQPDSLYATFLLHPSLSIVTAECTLSLIASFDSAYQAIYLELSQNDHAPCAPAQTMITYEILPPAPRDMPVTIITQTVSVFVIHFPPAPVPSTMTTYTPYFGYGYDSP
jgi:hypothetical protein